MNNENNQKNRSEIMTFNANTMFTLFCEIHMRNIHTKVFKHSHLNFTVKIVKGNIKPLLSIQAIEAGSNNAT